MVNAIPRVIVQFSIAKYDMLLHRYPRSSRFGKQHLPSKFHECFQHNLCVITPTSPHVPPHPLNLCTFPNTSHLAPGSTRPLRRLHRRSAFNMRSRSSVDHRVSRRLLLPFPGQAAQRGLGDYIGQGWRGKDRSWSREETECKGSRTVEETVSVAF